ncbi:formylglycine-generating enzyme required for sulfatase activity [Frischella perrara]|uniref:Sulfatase-modifying factor enzyme-like domain-containing protein n=1 Tax=Frischella perrara TaxID=1267021 RepID=A0A0A7S4H2_FRIPE|nr:SUMF1/EgtB/PvdO family nonheme iron enzyme [Frischella perrara]AJA45752.1 hypothetical protein FPB0191_01941 [Frischella perrara]PWV60296.1 formylglycine-generating enzyme required for sulfatase activity [Frischella perrara]
MNKKGLILGCSLGLLMGCDSQMDNSVTSQNTALQSEIAELITRSKSDMVFIEGGEFMMGDFGPLDKEKTGGLYYGIGDYGVRTIHKVRLKSYSLSRYQITFHDYLLYRKSKGLGNPYPIEHITAENRQDGFNSKFENKKWLKISTNTPESPRQSETPAFLPWEAAQEYCQWLGEQTGLPYSLPTEAQWEYAARNRGQFVLYPTDNGLFEPGRNVPSDEQQQQRSRLGGIDSFPVGSFPATPLGLYDMGYNKFEWVNDWFDPDYYSHSPEANPQGPAEAVFTDGYGGTGFSKVVRGYEYPTDLQMTFSRTKHKLWLEYTPEVFDGFYYVTARCAINSERPVN